MAAEQKQRDVSRIHKLRENMSPRKEVMVQSMKGVTKNTRVVHIAGKVTQDQLRDDWCRGMIFLKDR